MAMIPPRSHLWLNNACQNDGKEAVLSYACWVISVGGGNCGAVRG